LQADPLACSPHRPKIENKNWVRKKYITDNNKLIPNKIQIQISKPFLSIWGKIPHTYHTKSRYPEFQNPCMQVLLRSASIPKNINFLLKKQNIYQIHKNEIIDEIGKRKALPCVLRSQIDMQP
jgi:hypothetical protein